MYKVTLQKDNRLINKLFNTREASNDAEALFMSNLLLVLGISYNKKINAEELDVEIKGRPYSQDGQFITIETSSQKKYIFFSYERSGGTRNGYIVSKIPIALRQWYNDSASNKSFEVFLLDVNKEDYQKENYKNVNFLNYSKSQPLI